jgi:hypothetical protein
MAIALGCEWHKELEWGVHSLLVLRSETKKVLLFSRTMLGSEEGHEKRRNRREEWQGWMLMYEE